MIFVLVPLAGFRLARAIKYLRAELSRFNFIEAKREFSASVPPLEPAA